jgi:hypothetical protein
MLADGRSEAVVVTGLVITYENPDPKAPSVYSSVISYKFEPRDVTALIVFTFVLLAILMKSETEGAYNPSVSIR